MTKLKNAIVALLGVTVVVLVNSTPASVAHTESFDKPIRKTVVNLGRSPYLMPNNPDRIQLSCFFYQDFMVKELNDPGVKGVRSVTVTPTIKESAPLSCGACFLRTIYGQGLVEFRRGQRITSVFGGSRWRQQRRDALQGLGFGDWKKGIRGFSPGEWPSGVRAHNGWNFVA